MGPLQPVKLTVSAPNILQSLNMMLNIGIYCSDSSWTALTARLNGYGLCGFYSHTDRVILNKSLNQYTSTILKKQANFKAICKWDLGSKQPPTAISTIYLDSKGVLIFAYFANYLCNHKLCHDLTQGTQYNGRTSIDMAQWGPTVVLKHDEKVLGVARSLTNTATTKPSPKPQAIKHIMHDGILVNFTLVVMLCSLPFFL